MQFRVATWDALTPNTLLLGTASLERLKRNKEQHAPKPITTHSSNKHVYDVLEEKEEIGDNISSKDKVDLEDAAAINAAKSHEKKKNIAR